MQRHRTFSSEGCADAMCEAAEVDRDEFMGSPEGNAMAAMQEEIDTLKREREALKMQAQIHAQEARGANHTIGQIYQIVTQRTGEPGNWNGAQPVASEIKRLRDFAKGVTDDLGFAEWATPGHAEDLLRELIDKWHPKGRAALATGR